MQRGPLYWHQGLFLQPQHFQLLNQQLPEMLIPLLSKLSPHFYGLISGGLNVSALAAQRLELAETSLLLPQSASVLSCPGNAVCAARLIQPDSIPADASRLVYIGIRATTPGEPSVTIAKTAAEMSSAPTRLAAPVDPENVADQYGDGPPAPVRTLSYVLNLVFEDELEHAGHLELMPLARLLRRDDAVILDDSYIGPCLSLNSSNLLMDMIRELRDRVLAKAANLEGYKNLSGRDSISADFTLLLMALRTLSRYAARLEMMVASPCQSPWEAYGILREFAAELSVFSVEADAMATTWEGDKVIPNYSHQDLGPCFYGINHVIFSLLENISAAPRYVLRFHFEAPLWKASLPQELALEPQSTFGGFWLVVHSDELEPHLLRQQVSDSLKIAANTAMNSLLVRALPGFQLLPSDGPPAGLPRRRGACYFELMINESQWQEVTQSQSLSMHWSDAPSDFDAQLAILSR